MTAYNVVRFRVKPGLDNEFINRQRASLNDVKGLRDLALIKTGERTYCLIGKWDKFDDIVAARAQMIGSLDKIRDLLEDLGSGLGVTDPVSGSTVLELGDQA
ncbi:MAG TPA: DUF718 domain-containing protein [Devosia sp.]|jgi:hypothetical protein|nr:DUF718 domain-containing protein [Devosia sp.]